mgnify:CR=1 FL=1
MIKYKTSITLNYDKKGYFDELVEKTTRVSFITDNPLTDEEIQSRVTSFVAMITSTAVYRIIEIKQCKFIDEKLIWVICYDSTSHVQTQIDLKGTGYTVYTIAYYEGDAEHQQLAVARGMEDAIRKAEVEAFVKYTPSRKDSVEKTNRYSMPEYQLIPVDTTQRKKQLEEMIRTTEKQIDELTSALDKLIAERKEEIAQLESAKKEYERQREEEYFALFNHEKNQYIAKHGCWMHTVSVDGMIERLKAEENLYEGGYRMAFPYMECCDILSDLAKGKAFTQNLKGTKEG